MAESPRGTVASAPPAPASRSIAGWVRRRPTIWPILALAALLAYDLLAMEGFGRLAWHDGRLHGQLVNILRDACPVLLLAVGMTLVIATAGIDLSVGSVMAISGAVAALLLMGRESAVPLPRFLALLRPDGPAPIPLAIACAIAAAALLGAWNGLLVAYIRLQPIVATLVLLVAGRGLAQALTSDQKVSFAAPAFERIGTGHLLGLPAPAYIVAAVAAVVFLALRKTALGMYIEAVGSNLRAARMAGLRIHAIRIAAYTFSAVCAALAGLIVTADIKLADVSNSGLYMELDAILAVVIGGTSLSGGRPRLLGSLVGALIMQTLSTTLTMNSVGTGVQLIVKATVAVAVCLIQTPLPAALAGRLAARPRRKGATA